MRLFLALILFIASTTCAHAVQKNSTPKPEHYGFSNITLSGISSGAFMGLQLIFTHSKSFDGAALVAGGPYLCAFSNPMMAVQVCMKNPESIDVDVLKKLIDSSGNQDLKNLTGKHIHLYHGLQDNVVKWKSSFKTTELLPAINDRIQVSLHLVPGMGHTWPTVGEGNGCEEEKVPWIGKCNFDFAALVFTGLHGPLKPKKAAKANSFVSVAVDPLLNTKQISYLAKTAYAYVPQTCKAEKCALHVSLHGCAMNDKTVGDAFIKKSGLNEWAESNNIVVLYPQVEESSNNPHGCWDWFGYTGKDYADKNGTQQKALVHLISVLREKLGLPIQN